VNNHSDRRTRQQEFGSPGRRCGEKLYPITVRVPEELHQTLAAIALAEDRSISHVCCFLIEHALASCGPPDASTVGEQREDACPGC
jgi:hypothetical protein